MALAHAIMTALIEDDLSGYELARDFETSLGFFWHASHQQIYQELRKLAEKGWLNRREVAQSGKPDKIVYGLTAKGRVALADWVFGTTRTQAAKDELLVKLYNLSGDNVAHLANEIRAPGADDAITLSLRENPPPTLRPAQEPAHPSQGRVPGPGIGYRPGGAVPGLV